MNNWSKASIYRVALYNTYTKIKGIIHKYWKRKEKKKKLKLSIDLHWDNKYYDVGLAIWKRKCNLDRQLL